ncbi:MAG: acetylxylan esterase [Clostridia bacterium]|nr:acetylxylan esterase [Clostridia bacterium]
MKHQKWLFFVLLVLVATTSLVSCDILAQYIPGLVPATTTGEATTMTTTEGAPVTTAPVSTAPVTTAPVTTVTTAATTVKVPVPVAPNAIVEKTPANVPVFDFDGNLAAYAVGYETGAEAAAETLATALGKTAAAYDASVAASLHLAIKPDGILPLAAGDYHIYVTAGTIHILGGDAAGLSAGVTAFLATVEDGTTAMKSHEHVIHKSHLPLSMETVDGYATKTQLVGGTTETSTEYELGDEVIFVLELKTNGAAAGCPKFKYTISADDIPTREYIKGEVSGESGFVAVTVPASFTRYAGSVRVQVDAYDSAGTLVKGRYSNGNTAPNYTFIGGAIIDFENVTSDVPEPSNFEEFWLSLLEDLPDPTKAPSSTSRFYNGFQIYKMDETYMQKIGQNAALLEDFDIYEIFLYCDVSSGRPAVGYVSVPKNKLGTTGTLPIKIGLNSYSGGASSRDGFFATDENAIRVCMHPQGMPLYYYNSGEFNDSGLKSAGVNDNFGLKGSDFDDPANAELTKMLLRNVQMLRFLSDDAFDDEFPSRSKYHNLTKDDKEAFQALRDTFNGTIVFNEGGSMGGFQNVATAALCGMATEIDVMSVSVGSVAMRCPWMCDPVSMAGLTGRIGGAGTRIGAGQSINIAGLAYLDTAHFAKYLPEGSTLTILGGYADTTCPSSGIVALYNAATVEKKLTLRQNCDHSGSQPATWENAWTEDIVEAPAQ